MPAAGAKGGDWACASLHEMWRSDPDLRVTATGGRADGLARTAEEVMEEEHRNSGFSAHRWHYGCLGKPTGHSSCHPSLYPRSRSLQRSDGTTWSRSSKQSPGMKTAAPGCLVLLDFSSFVGWSISVAILKILCVCCQIEQRKRLILMGARVLTVEEGIHNYGMG